MRRSWPLIVARLRRLLFHTHFCLLNIAVGQHLATRPLQPMEFLKAIQGAAQQLQEELTGRQPFVIHALERQAIVRSMQTLGSILDQEVETGATEPRRFGAAGLRRAATGVSTPQKSGISDTAVAFTALAKVMSPTLPSHVHLFGAIPDSLIPQILGCLAARDLSQVACVKTFRGFVSKASRLAFAARFGGMPSVLQPRIDERALWKDIVFVEDALATVERWEANDLQPQPTVFRLGGNHTPPKLLSTPAATNLYRRLSCIADGACRYMASEVDISHGNAITIEGAPVAGLVHRLDGLRTIAFAFMFAIVKYAAEPDGASIQHAAGRAIHDVCLMLNSDAHALTGHMAVISAGFFDSIAIVFDVTGTLHSQLKTDCLDKLTRGRVPKRRVLASERDAYDRAVSLAQSTYDALLASRVTSSRIMEQYVINEAPDHHIEVVMRLTKASPELFAHFSSLTQGQEHIIDDLVQSFNKEVFQQGLLDETISSSAHPHSSTDPQSGLISFSKETAAALALDKWLVVFRHMRTDEELRKRLLRAGLLEALSGILAAARAPVTVDEEDKINLTKALSRSLCRPVYFPSVLTSCMNSNLLEANKGAVLAEKMMAAVRRLPVAQATRLSSSSSLN